ncbi:alpha/beta hydrolase [Streptomyces sp. NPDC058284]|uniref:alpha/beta hydrolase n=1 Tax=unclassified Streptomyces TaxID=2593676 RepID=UPI003661F645
MKKRAVVLCSVAAVAAAMVTAVPPAAGAPGAAPPPQLRTQAPPLLAHPSLTWKKCATKDRPTLQCASLKVPLDHQEPGGRQLTLALSRVPHTAKSFQGPLLVNPGGPGGSGLAMAGFVAGALPKKVAAQYDVVGFDPRGVGKSRPALNCRPGHFSPVRPATVPTTAALERANLDRARKFARACESKYGDILPFIDSVSVVQDMDAIRAALKAERINYYGYSYGTYLGALYGKLYPHRVRRMALDSLVDPTGVWYDDNLRQDYAFDARHKAFMAWIARHDATYRLGKDPGRVEAKWYAMRKAVTRKPAGKKVGGAELEDTFMPGAYFNGYWPILAKAFAAYANGKETGPLVKAYEGIGAVDAAGENGYSVYTAVQCRDVQWPRDWRTWRDDNDAAHAKAPFATWNNAWYNAPCAFWPTHHLSPPDTANSELPPVLLFQATDDPATPYDGAIALHRNLGGSRLVVEQGGGNHGITLRGNRCLDRHLAAYLRNGKVPQSDGEVDAVCEALPDPKPPQATKGRSDTVRGALAAFGRGALSHPWSTMGS